MPPAAVVGEQPPYPLCCGAFDIGEIEIEVQAVDDDIRSPTSTQVVVLPRDFGKKDEKARDDYFTGFSSPMDRSLADSFDSTDEIVEGSNEMKLMKRVVGKQRANSNKKNIIQQRMEQQTLWVQQQDSMSDTNSVNSNDVFSIDDSNQIEYLDVLEEHRKESNSDDDVFHHSNPYRQGHRGNLNDIIETLCDAPCGECLPDLDILADERNDIIYPKSVLRTPRYSSPEKYAHSKPATDALQKYSVQFQNVDIRSFKMTLGNHPSATTGPPVMLDGELMEPKHLARKIIPLEKYEQTRAPRRKRRQLKLTLQQRHNILVKEQGFSFEEVKGAWKESLEIRRQRKETLERGLAMMKWDEVWESTCRKFDRLVMSAL